MIATLLPSRGMVHSRTIEELLVNLKGYKHRLLFTHSLGIPEAFNDLLKRGLKLKPDWLWFVEEDMSLPPDTLWKMLTEKGDVITVNYPVTDKRTSVIHAGKYLIFGTGCTLIRPSVFKRVGAYFTADVGYTWPDMRPYKVKFPTAVYGMHDAEFSVRCAQAGIKVSVSKAPVTQYRLKAFKPPQVNNGWYEVYTL